MGTLVRLLWSATSPWLKFLHLPRARTWFDMGGLGPLTQTVFSWGLFSWILFFYFQGDWSLRTGPTPPLEWTSFPSLVATVSITRKGAESPGSRRIGVIGALVYFLPSKTVGVRGGGGPDVAARPLDQTRVMWTRRGEHDQNYCEGSALVNALPPSKCTPPYAPPCQ